MDWLWYVVPVVITAAVLFFKLKRQVKFKNNIPIIAQSLGLKYFDRIDQLSDHIAEAKTDLPSALSDPENVKELQKYAQIISIWKIEGEFNGVQVKITPRVIGSRKSRSGYTRLEAFFPQPKTLGLTISNMGNTSLGKPEIKIDSLDKKIIIKCDDETTTLQLLNDSDVQDAINKAFEFSSNVVIDDSGTHLDKHGPPPLEADYYRQVLDCLTRIILTMDRRYRFLFSS
ncbi:hypothetical protein L0244_10810 [bacterium]|nr:hypothetical protein [bacterium]